MPLNVSWTHCMIAQSVRASERKIHQWWISYIYIHRVSKWMSSHKKIVVISRGKHYFNDYIYITPISCLWNLSTLCVIDRLWPYFNKSAMNKVRYKNVSYNSTINLAQKRIYNGKKYNITITIEGNLKWSP